MKKINSLLLVAVSLFWLSSCTQAPESDEAKTGGAQEVSDNNADQVYKIDNSASKLNWIATRVNAYHVGIVPVAGGELHLKDGNIVGGSVTLDMKNLIVNGPKGSDAGGNAKLTGHLKSPDFFETDKYAESKFEITGVKPFEGTPAVEEADPRQDEISQYKVANPSHIVSGNLTIKDITKNIEFPALITVTDNSVEAIAKFNIDRRLWNINYPGQPNDLIRDMIHYGITLKALKGSVPQM